jgi:glutathione S-transferase
MTLPVLHIANKNYSSWSLRPWVLMRELAIGFEERVVPFVAAGESNPFLAFSPTGKVPCLVDGDTVVWDSLAIAEYLAERRPDVWPLDARARAWARCAAAEMHAGFGALRGTCGMNCGLRVRIDPFPAPVLADVARLDTLWNDGLSRFGGPFLGGRLFTVVDAFFAPVAFRVQTYAPPLGERSRAYVDRLLALPSMRAWYEAALAEPWRDAAHDDEARGVGTVVQDLRGPAAGSAPPPRA